MQQPPDGAARDPHLGAGFLLGETLEVGQGARTLLEMSGIRMVWVASGVKVSEVVKVLKEFKPTPQAKT